MASRCRYRWTTSRRGTSRIRTCKGARTPPDLQSGALPFGHGSITTRTGVEPVAFWSTARCANRYTYGPGGMGGVVAARPDGSGGIRTPKAPKRPGFTDRCDSPSSPRSRMAVRVGLEPTRPLRGRTVFGTDWHACCRPHREFEQQKTHCRPGQWAGVCLTLNSES